MKATPEQIASYEKICLERGGTIRDHQLSPDFPPTSIPSVMSAAFLPGQPKPLPKARARTRPERGTMNKLEARYARYLDERKAVKDILVYFFERVQFRLAQRTTYTPDFMVIQANGLVEFHEVKGFWEDDARVKIKVAAQMYWPFLFVAVKEIAKKNGGGWEKEIFNQ